MLSDNRAFNRNKILAVVAAHFGVTTEDIRGRRRWKRVAVPRHVAAWIMRRAGYRFIDIGEEINRDHSTAHYGVGVIERMREEDAGFAAELDTLEEKARAK